MKQLQPTAQRHLGIIEGLKCLFEWGHFSDHLRRCVVVLLSPKDSPACVRISYTHLDRITIHENMLHLDTITTDENNTHTYENILHWLGNNT